MPIYFPVDRDAEAIVRRLAAVKDVDSESWALAVCIIALLDRADESDTYEHEQNEY